MRISRLFPLAALLAIACPPPVDLDDSDTDTDSGSDSDTGLIGPFAEVLVADHSLALSSVVVVDGATYEGGPYFVTVRSSVGVSFGDVPRGSHYVASDEQGELHIEIDPPAIDGELLWVVLHADADSSGDLSLGHDPVIEYDGAQIAESFRVTVVPSTPEVWISMVTDAGALRVDSFIPQARRAEFLGGQSAEIDNPTLALPLGARVEVQHLGATALQLVKAGTDPSLDTLLLSQGTVQGSLETDVDIDWTDTLDGLVRFTVTAGLLDELDLYRDDTSPDTARGPIVIAP